MAERNPIILPSREGPSRQRCPKCGGVEFGGQRVEGVITFTCRIPECRNQWQGGLPRVPYDPLEPRLPEPTPLIDYGKNPRTGEIEEIRRSPSLVPEYRKGLPFDDEENK